MFEPILQGVKPTDLFRILILNEPGLTNSKLGGRFVDFFENVDSVARQVIWYWHRSGQRQGLSDENVNAQLIELLQNAGYEIKQQCQ